MNRYKLNKIIATCLTALMLATSVPFKASAKMYITDVRTFDVTATNGTGVPTTVSYFDGVNSYTFSRVSIDGYTVKATTPTPVYKTVTQTVTVPKAITSLTATTPSTWSYTSPEGLKGTLTKTGSPYVSGGQIIPADTQTVSITNTSNSTTPTKITYNQDGYTGTLTGGTETKTYLYGDYIPADTKTVTQNTTQTFINSNSDSQFSSNMSYNQNGYSGTLKRTSVLWNLINSKTNRVSPVLSKETISAWDGGQGWGIVPNYITVSYYDSELGKNVSGSIKWLTCVVCATQQSVIYSQNNNISWMSNNPYTYYNGRAYWTDPWPLWFTDNYSPGPGWLKWDINWNGSLKGSGAISDTGIYNTYFRLTSQLFGKYITENKWDTVYQGTIPLPNILTYQGTATYSGSVTKPAQDNRVYQYSRTYTGTVTRPQQDLRTFAQDYTGTITGQVVDHYVDTPSLWTATATYGGYVTFNPVANFSMASTGYTNYPVTIQNTSTDQDNNITSTVWTISGGTTYTKSLNSSGGTITFTKAGTYSVKLTVTDSDGLSSTKTKSVTVTDFKGVNDKPVVTLTVDPPTVYEGDAVTFTHTATSATSTIAKTEYTLTNLDTGIATKTILTCPSGLQPVGHYTLAFRALSNPLEDASGNVLAAGVWSDYATVSFTVLPRNLMEIKSLSLTGIVNPPKGTIAPISYPVDTPTRIKAGYKLNYNTVVSGGDTLTVKLYSEGQPIKIMTATGEQDYLTITKNESQTDVPLEFWLDKNFVKGSVIDMKIILEKHNSDGTVTSVVNNELGNQCSVVVGSALEDSSVNLTN